MKQKRRALTIKGVREAEGEFIKIYGPKSDFAKLTLKGSPADQLSFSSNADWPSGADNCDDAVLEGILDEIYCSGLGVAVSKVAFELDQITWHEVDSSPHAFYHAARDAVRKIFGIDDTVDYLETPKG